MELKKRDIAVTGKKRTELEEELTKLQKGVANVPALLQHSPETTLESLGLGKYEVLPTEPLHDLKGHFSNIIEEALKTTSGVVLSALKGIQSTVLNKATLRASDYRKAVILMYQSLRQCSTGKNDITELFRTAAEISEILYARPCKRTP